MASEYGFLLGRNATLICLGDSITEAPDGYVTVMRNLIAAGYPERNVRVVNAGISGNRAPDMLARLQQDVIAHRPQWVTINVGINDVWHAFYRWDPPREIPDGSGENGVPLEIYEPTLAEMVDILRESTDAEIVLLTPTVLGEDVDNPDNRANARLEQYVAAMERVAGSRQTRIAPTHRDFVQAIRAGRSVNPDFRLTTDGVHMNPVGNHVLALTVLATLGFAGLGS
jgi:lysophospholipase L1-like esterase